MTRTTRPPAAPTPGQPAPPAADHLLAWRADAVRHQLLLRALPAQRHEVLGPLSVLRMALALLQRKPPADAATLQARLADLVQQVQDGVAAVAAMRCWDGGRAAPQPLPQVVGTVGAWLRTAASLHGHRLDEPVPSAADGGAPATPLCVAVPDAHYALLGLLVHVLDSAARPLALHWRLDGPAVALLARPLDGPLATAPPAPGLTERPDGQRPLHREALGWLLDDLGWRLDDPAAGGQRDGEAVWLLHPPAGGAPRSP